MESIEKNFYGQPPAETPESIESFESFGFKNDIMKGIKNAGFKKPSPIQEQAIPKILAGHDIVGQAHTGTGKTAAFGLSLMNMMKTNCGIETLVITPTRELAMQVSDELFSLGQNANIKTATVYGGQSYSKQLERISKGAQIIIATPGRLLDMLQSKKLKNFNPGFVVLDEADEMLDMGFLDDIKKIFKYLPKERQTLLFSATMPNPIKSLAKTILKNPDFITITKSETTNKDIKQQYYVIEEHERDDAITRLLDSEEPEKSIVFCRMKKEVDRVSTTLTGRGYSAKGLHGDMDQRQREDVIRRFKSGKLDILVATDVAARGLDVTGVSHVFNYHIPFDPESYVHRIGRTGRAGNKGIAITFVTPLEFKELARIRKKVGTTMEHSYIPTIQDLKSAGVEKFIDEIKHQHINNEAAKILSTLEEEIDISQVSFKLISMLLDKRNVVGPNSIGINASRLNKMLEKLSHDKGNKNKRRGRKRYSSSGRKNHSTRKRNNRK